MFSDRAAPRLPALYRLCRPAAIATFFAAILIITAPNIGSSQEAPEIAEGKVDAALDASADRDVRRRLRATFAALDELQGVVVEVEAGVVRLDGEVNSVRSQELAGKLAAQINGVTAVENRIEETRSVRRRLSFAVERLQDRTWKSLDSLPLLLVAITVFLIAFIISRFITRFEAPFRLLTKNVFLQDLARQASRIVVIMGGALIALEIMDATGLVGAIAGAAGVVGLAVGFAFRDLVENYVASVLLSIRQPFAPRDHVKIENHEGRVGRLTSRATILVTFDGNHVRIPNAIVFKSAIENFTRTPERRFSFGVGVGVDEDLVAAQQLGTSILEAMEGVIETPPPYSLIDELGDSSVTMQFYGWVDQRAADFGKVRSEAIRLVKQAFDQQGIEMPEPTHRIRVDSRPAQSEAATSQKPPQPPSPSAQDQVMDISVDHHVEQLAKEESGKSNEDLLSEDAKVE